MNSTDPEHKMAKLLALMARLRAAEDGCEWCREQTFETISAFTIEEAFEVADAIAANDLDGLCDELGDLLLQVVFHARMAEEAGRFSFGDVVNAITAKLTRRHPQLFAAATEFHATPVDWERIKQQERARKGEHRESLMDGVPAGLPALSRAEKVQKKAALVGFDWQHMQGPLDKLHEEIAELEAALRSGEEDAIHEELGDVFFTLVNLSRHLPGPVNAEQSLRRATQKFEQRFRSMERLRVVPLNQMTAGELEELWQKAKQIHGIGADVRK